MNLEEIAQVCHEANKAVCDAFGDTSQVAWDDAPEWVQESAIAGVHSLATNGDTVTPEELHNQWCQHKLDDGWTYGKEKDAVLKKHPCLVAYHRLPPEQKAKDYVLRAVAISLVKIAARHGDEARDRHEAA